MYTLKNDRLTVLINQTGAEIRSIKFDSEDVLWSGDPEFWAGVSPIMFPVCGGLRDDIFEFEGKQYPMVKHGYARFEKFEVESSTNSSVTFLHKSSEETHKHFPWDYELRITYSLHGAALDVRYDVKNTSDSTMLFSIGSHEGYACPEGIEDYDIIFPQKETLDAWPISGYFLEHKPVRLLKESNVFPLYYKYFAVDALVFKDLKSRSATLRNRRTGRSVTVNFPDCNYFLLWTRPDAGYICMEPWCGIQSMVDDGYDISVKEGIKRLAAGSTFTATHTINCN